MTSLGCLCQLKQFFPVLISARCRRFIKLSLIPYLQANNKENVRKFLPVDKVFATKSYFRNLMYFYLINVFPSLLAFCLELGKNLFSLFTSFSKYSRVPFIQSLSVT